MVTGTCLVTGLLSVTAGTGAVWLLVSVWSPSGYWPAVCYCRYWCCLVTGICLVTGLLSVVAGTDAVWLLSLITGMLWCGYCEEAQLSVLTWQRVNKNSGDCAQLKLGSLNCRACSVSESSLVPLLLPVSTYQCQSTGPGRHSKHPHGPVDSLSRPYSLEP